MKSRFLNGAGMVMAMAVVLFLGLSGCGKQRVEITAFEPKGEVEPLTTFKIDFSEDLAPAEQLETWSVEPYLEFEPKIQGRFKWTSPNRLLFSPEVALLPNQDYRMKVTDKVFFGKNELKSTFPEQTFHTPYFEFKGAEIHWSQLPHTQFKVQAQATLSFNYPVDPKRLPDFLHVTRNGEEYKAYKVSTEENSDLVVVDLGEQQQTMEKQVFGVEVAKGFASAVSEKGMGEDKKVELSLPPLTELEITGISSGVEEEKGWIEIVATQPLDDKVAMSYVSINPSVPFTLAPRGNALRIEGEFEPGAVLTVAVKKGMPGLYGGKLENAYSEQVVLTDLEPELKFSNENGQYLMRGGKENIQVRSVNVPKAEVEIFQIFENNILYFLYSSGSRYYSDRCCGANPGIQSSGESYDDEEYYEEDYYYDDYYYDVNADDYGKSLSSSVMEFPTHRNMIQTGEINLSPYINGRFRGIYLVKIRDSENYWRGNSKIVSVSDLGIIAKRSKNELVVFVNSIATTEPVANVEIRLISSNNQTLIKGVTDKNGMVVFRDTRKDIEDFRIRLLTASSGQDFNFIDFASTEIELSRYDVGGKPEYHEDYDTYLYGERNLYRPGETAHFNALVRTWNYDRANGMPLTFKVIDSRGRVFSETQKETDAEGAAEMELPLPTYAPTGDYHLEVKGGDGALMAEYTFSVEEFVPDKIRVEAETKETKVSVGQTMHLDIFSEYLFGTPCSEHDFEVDFNFTAQTFTSKKFPEYNFSPYRGNFVSLDNELITGKLDAAGKGTAEWMAPEELRSEGKYKGRAYVNVFDATGRTVTRVVPFEFFPQSAYLGIAHKGWYHRQGENLNFSLVAVTPEDKAAFNVPIEVEVIKHEWKTVVEKRNGDRYAFRSVKVEKVIKRDAIILNGSPKAYNFRLDQSGDYEVRMFKRGAENYVSSWFYVYGQNTSTSTSFEVDREGRVEVTPDKEKYQVGDKARLLFTTPFSGKMLVTLEREDMIEHHYVDVVNNAAELEVPITDKMLPNCYVTATLFKPHKETQGTPFFVGHGFMPISVEKASNRLAVEVVAPERCKPRRSQEIVVKTGAPGENVEVTLAVVDEGILQIKNFQSPDPYAYMYARRKLSVTQYDLYELLLDEVGSGASPAGSDDAAARRLNPITAQRFKLLSYWSGIRKSNGAGEVRLQVPLPHFNGSARIMAVAWSGPKFGASSKSMIITDDVVMMPALPRFLAPGDSLVMPVSFMNTTTKSGDLKVNIRTEGPVKVLSGGSQTLKMGSKDNKNLQFVMKVDRVPGVAKIHFETSGLDAVKDDVEIAVRPTAPLTVEGDGGAIKGGETKVVTIPGGFLPGTQRSALTIAKFPGVQFGKYLRNLLGYPHGCLEQTISKAFPQLYAEELIKVCAPDMLITSNSGLNVKEAIQKVQSMQLPDGSFAYWPGGTYSSWWGSNYACHFLLEAQKAGYEVNLPALEDGVQYLSRQAGRQETYTVEVWDGKGYVKQEKARKEVLYTLYIKALAGKSDKSLMNYYRSHPNLLTPDVNYLLAGAFGLANDWAAFRSLLPGAYSPVVVKRESGGTYDSPMRANALMLNVLMDVDPDNRLVPTLVNYLSKNAGSMYSTQDQAWFFLGMGKVARRSARSDVRIDLAQNGKSVGSFSGNPLRVDGAKLPPGQYSLKASGTGVAYYAWNTEGVPNVERPVVEIDNNLMVRRQYLDRNGAPISNWTFKQGDMVVCKVTVTVGAFGAENLAISDLLPSGVEIDNPRLAPSTQLPWIKNQGNVDHTEIRDDRMVLYTSLAPNSTFTVHYLLRAVNQGKFKLAPIGAEAMYDPEIRSYNGGGWVNIQKR